MLTQTSLSNGLNVLYLYTKNDPISAAHIFIPGGAAQETRDRNGITTLMWSLLLKGTTHRGARQIAEDIESLGASIGAGATHDYSEISAHSTSDAFLETLKIMAETLFKPAFDPGEVEKEKTHLIAAIQSKKESIFTVAYEELTRNLFGRHPYGRPVSGEEKTVATFTPRHLRAWHQRIVNPRAAVLSIASNIPYRQIAPLLGELFGGRAWPRRSTPPRVDLPKISTPRSLVKVKKKEAFEQAYLMIAYPGTNLESKDYVTLKVLNGCLGGGMSARLFQRLREQQGLAYDVGSFFPSKKGGSGVVFHLGLQADKIEQARAGILRELELVRDEEMPRDELEQTKNFLKGSYILDHQTNSQRAHYRGWWRVLGMKASADEDYLARLQTVKTGEIQAVARKYLAKPSVMVEIRPGAKAASA